MSDGPRGMATHERRLCRNRVGASPVKPGSAIQRDGLLRRPLRGFLAMTARAEGRNRLYSFISVNSVSSVLKPIASRGRIGTLAARRMPSNPPFPIPVVTEERQLAAIVFTDAVGFSARVHTEETPALGAMEEDFEVMRLFARQANGTVLKSMGDGLLIYFASAVHAVNWALRTQRHFMERGGERAARGGYRHRIGIHVGDVFKKADDVAGDGVNIAARVQGEAPPGGICITQTVYDLIKNKMELHTVRLEPRKLKNIRELIQMYHVLLEAPVRPEVRPDAAAPKMEAPEAPEPKVAAPRRVLWSVLALAAIAVGVWLLRRGLEKHDDDLARSQREQAALAAAIKDRTAEPATPAAVAVPSLENKVADFDFLRMTGERPAPASGTAETERAHQQANQAVTELQAWLRPELARYSRERTLPVGDRRVYGDAAGQIYFVQVGATAARPWADLSVDLKAAVIVSALRYAERPPASAWRGAEAFAFLHGLPAMAKELERAKATQAVLGR